MGLTFFADRLFKQNEMQTNTNRVYSSAIALTEVDDYVFNSAFDAAFASISKMYGGGDAPEDPLLGIIFTMVHDGSIRGLGGRLHQAGSYFYRY